MRYLRMLDRLDAKMTKALMQGLVEKCAYWEPRRPRHGSSLVMSTHPASNPAFEKHDNLIKAFIRAVAGVVDPGMIQHKSGWAMAVERLARDTHRNMRDAVRAKLGSGFDVVEEKHLDMRLPWYSCERYMSPVAGATWLTRVLYTDLWM
jgi:hypothetical protein